MGARSATECPRTGPQRLSYHVARIRATRDFIISRRRPTAELVSQNEEKSFGLEEEAKNQAAMLLSQRQLQQEVLSKSIRKLSADDTIIKEITAGQERDQMASTTSRKTAGLWVVGL